MILDEIQTYLGEQISGLTAGTNVFYSNMPDTPNKIVVVYDSGGLPPSRDIPDAKPTFQVMVRSESYSEGKTLVDSIVDALHQVRSTQLVDDGTFFYYIYLMGEPAHLGLDEKKRDEFSINFETRIRR